MAKPIFLPIS